MASRSGSQRHQHDGSQADTEMPRNDRWTGSNFSWNGPPSRGSSIPTDYSSIPPLGPAATAAEQRGQRTVTSSRKRSVPMPSNHEETTVRTRKQSAPGSNLEENVGESQRDFETDPAHEFWKWSVESQNWYHLDKATNTVLWAPLQLD
ncbi:hypothetical protein CKAH01_04187 [Colletotrichum kahawae]|uniref:Uncharacterized protein n=1 Tax=Colletotrichum kahawae TaxID=34407 RepID=A0AAD9YNC3_COLKA|nr:hypothetical protein CKAH01_04187 [Colletotrichum kahawae]